MFLNEETEIVAVAMHRVGSQTNPEGGIVECPQLLQVDEVTNEYLKEFFLSSFKEEGYYHFKTEESSQNAVYQMITSIMDNDESLYSQSVILLRSLYAKCTSEVIPMGEFYVVKFKNCFYEGAFVDAVGIFKSEKKEVYFDITSSDGQLHLQAKQGVGVSKIDKGCLVLDVDRTKGCTVAAFDHGKGDNGNYWIDEYLHLYPKEDNFFQTQQTITLCNDFVRKHLPENYVITKDQQADLLNRSTQFFKEREDFSVNEYMESVIEKEEVAEKFKQYKQDCERSIGYHLADDFQISEAAVKKQVKVFKSVIKLDKNFHVYIHGKRDLIRRDYDRERGLYYYQLYFKEED